MLRKNRWLLGALTLIAFSGFATLQGCTCGEPPATGIGKLATNQDRNEIIFTNIVVSEPKTLEFLLYNQGDAPLSIDQFELDRNTSNVFSIVKQPQVPLTLEPGQDKGVRITVQFLTKSAGDFQARLRVVTPDTSNVEEDGHFYIRLRHQILEPQPVFSCNQTMNFGDVERGKSKTMECEITNRGSAALEIKAFSYVKEKGSDKDFEWLEPALPAKLEANATTPLIVRIAYKPSDFVPPEDQGKFLLETNLSGNPDATTIQVVGKTIVPLVSLVPFYGECQEDSTCKRIDGTLSCTEDEFSKKKLCLPTVPSTTLFFPLTSKGRTTKRQFAIRSIGDLPLKVEKVELDSSSSLDFRVDAASVTLPLTIQPKQEALVTVEFTPTDDSPTDTGRVDVISDAANLPKAPMQLEARSQGCNLSVTPDKLKFTGPKSFQVTVYNVGNESCLVDRIFVEGQASLFSLIPKPKDGQAIAPNGQIDFLVRYSPGTNKAKVTDKIVIESSDPDESKIQIPLEGEVIGDYPCELEANPATLAFQLVPVGRTRRLSVRLKNKGYDECVIEQATPLLLEQTIPGPTPNSFSFSNPINYPFKIPSGEERRVDITFTPPDARPGFEGKLTIPVQSGQQTKFEVKLTGSSGNLCLEIVPTNMDFGSTKVGCATPRQSIQVFNLGAQGCVASISVTGVKLAQGTSPEFRLDKVPNLPVTLTSGNSIEILMSYKANDLNVDTGALDIENSVAGQSPIPVPLVGEGVSTDDQKDVFSQLKRPKTDIMFVVDDSCSMSEEQSSMANNFSAFINWAVRLNVDYNIIVVTTDVDTSNAKRGCARQGSGSSTALIDLATPDPIKTFQANVNVGINGSATEAGLEAAYLALTPPRSTGCNKGFYRTDASLSLIFVSDEVDQSKQPVQFYVSFFKNLKGLRNLDFVRASSIVGPLPSGCRNPGTGDAEASARYIEAAKQLKGVNESICNSNWSQTLSSVASITFGYRTQFFLSRQADPATITVKVNGQTVQEDIDKGWSYDPTTNSINFASSEVPPPGATIEVQYKAVCLP